MRHIEYQKCLPYKRCSVSLWGMTHRQKPKFNAPSIDAHQALGSPDGRAGAKRLRGLTAPIPHTKLHSCTNFLHIPLPLPGV